MPYRFRPNKPILPSMIRLVPGVGLSGFRRGLGDVVYDSSGEAFDSTTGTDLGYSVPGASSPSPSIPVPGSSVGGGGANPFEAALVNALPGALNIVGRVVAPTTTITGPGGTSITTPSSNAPSVLASTGFPAIGAAGVASLLPILMIGGLGLFVILLATKK